MTTSVCRGTWRTSKTPGIAVPLGARSVGHADVQPGWAHGTGTITFINVYWGEAGCGGPLVNDVRTEIPAGCLALHYPGDRISGYPVEQAWRYRWMTVDGPLARGTVEALGLTGPWPRAVGSCPLHLFDRLETEIASPGPAAEYRASALAYEILCLAARGPARPASKADVLEIVRRRIETGYAEASLTVERLASEAGLHRSRLCRLYRERYGLPPSAHLQQARLRSALAMLHDHEKSVKEIGYACGFSDPAYFSRSIRAATGLSPRALRHSFGGGSQPASA